MPRQTPPHNNDDLSGFAASTAPGQVQLERVYPLPLPALWFYLSNSALRREWFAAGKMDFRPGGRFSLVWKFGDLSPREEIPERYQVLDGYRQSGRITRFDEPGLLGLTWGEDAEVIFTLSPRGPDRTALVITHRRLEDRADMIRIASGWHAHLLLLEDVILDRDRRPFWKNFEAAHTEHERLLGEPPVIVRVSHRFRASAEDVFDAWTAREHVPLWMFAGDAGELVRADNDVRPGGEFVFTSREENGEIDHVGTWSEVSRPSRLVWTYCLPDYAPFDVDRVTLEIRARRGGGCEAVLTHEMKAVWAEYSSSAEAGWSDLLDEIADMIGDERNA